MDEKYAAEPVFTTGAGTSTQCGDIVCGEGKLPDLFGKMSNDAGSVWQALRHGTLTWVMENAVDSMECMNTNMPLDG